MKRLLLLETGHCEVSFRDRMVILVLKYDETSPIMLLGHKSLIPGLVSRFLFVCNVKATATFVDCIFLIL